MTARAGEKTPSIYLSFSNSIYKICGALLLVAAFAVPVQAAPAASKTNLHIQDQIVDLQACQAEIIYIMNAIPLLAMKQMSHVEFGLTIGALLTNPEDISYFHLDLEAQPDLSIKGTLRIETKTSLMSLYPDPCSMFVSSSAAMTSGDGGDFGQLLASRDLFETSTQELTLSGGGDTSFGDLFTPTFRGLDDDGDDGWSWGGYSAGGDWGTFDGGISPFGCGLDYETSPFCEGDWWSLRGTVEINYDFYDSPFSEEGWHGLGGIELQVPINDYFTFEAVGGADLVDGGFGGRVGISPNFGAIWGAITGD